MNDLVTKPIDPDDLFNKISKYVERPSIDISTVEKLRNSYGHDSTLVNELIMMFSKSAPEKVEAILNSLKLENWSSIEQEAHSLKSNAKTLGAARLGEICEDLENHKQHSVEKIASISLELQSETNKAVCELQGLLMKVILKT